VRISVKKTGHIKLLLPSFWIIWCESLELSLLKDTLELRETTLHIQSKNAFGCE
jgi:hypothetical protein